MIDTQKYLLKELSEEENSNWEPKMGNEVNMLTSWNQQRLFCGQMLTTLANTIQIFQHIILETDYPYNEGRDHQHFYSGINSHTLVKYGFLTIIIF